MSWKKVLSVLIAGSFIGVPLYASADNDRDDRGDNKRHDRQEAKKKKKEALNAQHQAQLVTAYTALVGSEANAKSLVVGMHDDVEMVVTRGTTTMTTVTRTFIEPCTSTRPRLPPRCGEEQTITETVPVTTEVTERFLSPTGPLKYKRITIVFAIMQGVFENNPAPSPAQIKDVLVGANGILTLRAKRMSWEKIVHKQGLKVRDVTRQVKYADGKHDDRDDDDDDDD